jgi:hypothetical protein
VPKKGGKPNPKKLKRGGTELSQCSSASSLAHKDEDVYILETEIIDTGIGIAEQR